MNSGPTCLTYAMYIFVNTDLKMDKGKIAGQVGHVVQKIIEKILVDFIPMENPDDKTKEIISNYIKWKTHGMAKIILKASQVQLEEFMNNSTTCHVRDSGLTQIAPNSLTVVGFYPESKENMNVITSGFKLL